MLYYYSALLYPEMDGICSSLTKKCYIYFFKYFQVYDFCLEKFTLSSK